MTYGWKYQRQFTTVNLDGGSAIVFFGVFEGVGVWLGRDESITEIAEFIFYFFCHGFFWKTKAVRSLLNSSSGESDEKQLIKQTLTILISLPFFI